MPKHGTILTEAARTIAARRADYGEPADNFQRASVIASTILGANVSPYAVSVIMHAMKLARIAQSPQNADHYRDGVSYLAFAAEFANGTVPADIEARFADQLAEIVDGSRERGSDQPPAA